MSKHDDLACTSSYTGASGGPAHCPRRWQCWRFFRPKQGKQLRHGQASDCPDYYALAPVLQAMKEAPRDV